MGGALQHLSVLSGDVGSDDASLMYSCHSLLHHGASESSHEACGVRHLPCPACRLDAMLITLARDHVHLASNVGLTGFQLKFGARSQVYDLRETFY